MGFLAAPVYVLAQASSNNYRLEESFFGTGGEVDASSNNYRSRQSAGALGVGDVSSTNYDASLGNITQDQPFLEMVVTGGPIDFGDLSSSSTSYGSPVGGACNCSFYVRTYYSSSYVVLSANNQPATSEGGAYLAPKTVLGPPSGSQSTEEFGYNLVANTSPGNFGANPTNQPDNSFADGVIASGYDTPNEFKFGAGETLVQSPGTIGNPAIGQTDYTISYIAKKKPTTPAGMYVFNHDLVAVATY